MWHLNWGYRYQDKEARGRRRRRVDGVSAHESQHRTKEQTRNQVMYKLTSDTMGGVCASVREAHIQGDNEQGRQKDGTGV